MQNHEKVRKLVLLAILTALVVVMQTIGSVIRIGPIPISLTLVPIVVGAVTLGIGAGAFLGGVFGLVCLIAGITGTDQFTFLMWTMSPFWLVIVCMGKAIACGAGAGAVFKLLKKNQTLGCIAAAISAPIINTGIFCIGMLTVFRPLLQEFAGGSDAVTFLFLTMIGVNFLVEFGVNAVLSAAIGRIARIFQKQF